MGFIIFTALVITFLISAIKLYFKISNKENKLLVFISLLSVITYIIHGLLNNYLDTDKAAVPFWGFLAIVCSIDIYCSENQNPQLGELRKGKFNIHSVTL